MKCRMLAGIAILAYLDGFGSCRGNSISDNPFAIQDYEGEAEGRPGFF